MSGAGTSSEQIQLNAGGDVWPGCVKLDNAGTITAAQFLPSIDCNADSLKAMGFESICIYFEGLPAGAAFTDLELIYHVEAVPTVSQSTVVPGLQPAAASVPQRTEVASREKAQQMLLETQLVPSQTFLDPKEALTGLASMALGTVGGPLGALGGMALSAATGRPLTAYV